MANWLEDLLGPRIAIAGVEMPARRALLNFASGATAIDNPAAGRIDITVSGGGGGGPSNVVDGTIVNQVAVWNGTQYVGGQVNLASGAARTGTLPVGSGGTGIAALGAANTVLTVNAAGTANQYQQIANAHVGAAAAIAGTKISPDFGVQDLITTGNLLLGPTPRAAASGLIRVGYTQNIIVGRNGSNSGDMVLVRWGVSGGGDNLELGVGVTSTLIQGTAVHLSPGGTSRLLASATAVSLGVNDFRFNAAGVVAPVIRHDTDVGVSGHGQPLAVRAQSMTGNNRNGGPLLLQGGAAHGSGTRGSVRVQLNATDTVFTTVMEAADVGAASALGFFAATPVVKPAATGSRADPEQALASVLTALANLGLLTNSTTA